MFRSLKRLVCRPLHRSVLPLTCKIQPRRSGLAAAATAAVLVHEHESNKTKVCPPRIASVFVQILMLHSCRYISTLR